MPTFKSLSYGDRWRVNRLLARGGAPADPRMAAAAIELAESCQDRMANQSALVRWLPVVAGVLLGAATIYFAIEGDTLVAVLNGIAAATNFAQLVLNPMFRPRNVARSLEASRQVSAQARGVA